MKSKKSIYILLPIVLLIWGLVIYQFFSFSNEQIPETTTIDFSSKSLNLKKRDSFSIEVTNRDPFLGKLTSEKKAITHSTTSNQPKTNTTAVKKVNEIVWPDITYKGIVSDTKEKVKVFMIIINGETFFMRKGQQEQEVTLKDGDRETIYVIYKKQLKVVFIQ